jgi:hypothetical protein
MKLQKRDVPGYAFLSGVVFETRALFILFVEINERKSIWTAGHPAS